MVASGRAELGLLVLSFRFDGANGATYKAIYSFLQLHGAFRPGEDRHRTIDE
jgi:hypothetical protein